MSEATYSGRRASWTFVLALAAGLGGCFIFARSLKAGDQPENTAPVADLHDHSEAVESGVPSGPGQPLDFYERFFGPGDPTLGPRVACFAPGTDEHVMA